MSATHSQETSVNAAGYVDNHIERANTRFMGPPELAKKLVEALRSQGLMPPQRLSVQGGDGEIIHVLVVTESLAKTSRVPEPVTEPPSRVRQRDSTSDLPEEELS